MSLINLPTCSQGKYDLHIYECDEAFVNIRPTTGSPFELTIWFANNSRAIRHLCFVGGSDANTTEVCLADDANNVCIYSLASAQLL